MKKPITIYHSGAFGITKIEANLIEFGSKPYAQYNDAPFIKFVPKGKRKPSGYIATSYPYLVVIEGHGHLSPGDAFTKPVSDGSVTVKQTIYASFDDRYKTDFDKNLDEYITGKTVLIDVRHTKGTKVINK